MHHSSHAICSARQRRVSQASNLNYLDRAGSHAARVSAPVFWGPLVIGLVLYVAAVALLTEDAIRTGHVTVQHWLQPVLAGGAAAAAIYMHRSFAQLRIGYGLAFALVAALGSLLVVYGTLGRQADAREARQAGSRGGNAAHTEKSAELLKAKAERDRECRSGYGKQCREWQSRVDALGKELRNFTVASVDPRADAIGEFASLLGFDGNRTKEIVSALDPVALPAWLELASIVFLGAAFPHRRKRRRKSEESETLAEKCSESVLVAEPIEALSHTRSEALADFRSMRSTPSQKALADRWQVSEGTVSKWLAAWATDGLISRGVRLGKERAALALPAPHP